MRTIILALLLFSQERPHPFSNPNDADDPSQRLVYEGQITAKKNTVVIPFLPERFALPPSCSFKGATLPGKIPDVTRDSASLEVRKGGTITYKCEGRRGEARPEVPGEVRARTQNGATEPVFRAFGTKEVPEVPAALRATLRTPGTRSAQVYQVLRSGRV